MFNLGQALSSIHNQAVIPVSVYEELKVQRKINLEKNTIINH